MSPGCVVAVNFVVEPNHEQLTELTALVDARELRPEVDSVFPLTESSAAFERVAARGMRGKVVRSLRADTCAPRLVMMSFQVRDGA